MDEIIDMETGEITQAFYRRSDEIAELFAALAKAQGKFEGAEKNATNPAFKSKYATLDAALEATKAGRSENGLALIQIPSNYGNNIAVTTLLGHTSGQWIESTMHIMPGKADAQGAGSAITYLRKYSLMAVLGIAPEDDDGNAASSGQPQMSRASPASSAPVYRQVPQNGGATKANPAVAPPSADRDAATASFKHINDTIKACQTEQECRAIYDEILDEWGEAHLSDVETVRQYNADSIGDLQRRVGARTAAIRASTQDAAAE